MMIGINDGKTYAGITESDLEALRDGKALVIQFRQYGIDAPPLLLFWQPTDETMLAKLKEKGVFQEGDVVNDFRDGIKEPGLQ